MDIGQQDKLAALLVQQREGTLDAGSRTQLDDLMGIYRRGMVHRAEALKAAVEPGLRSPLGTD